MYDSSEIFSSNTIFQIKEAIEENDLNEVLFLGFLDESGKVSSIEILTRGNIHSTPAILNIEGPNVVVIHNHPSGDLTPSDADISVAGFLGNNLVGFYIIDNNVKKVNVVVRPVFKEVTPINAEKLIEYLTPASSRSLSSQIEERESQKIMLTKVVEAFNENKIALIEAGTGTGKTWAYLIPSMEWSEKNTEKIILSTYTINLQEQIISDFHSLNKKIKNGTLKISILKGRGNYLCKLRLEKIVASSSLLLPENSKKEHLKVLKQWAEHTTSGTRSDLTTSVPDELWEEVAATGDTCIGNRCKYYPDECFYFKSRKRSLTSNIIVVNHHLTFADYFLKKQMGDNSVIPEYQRIIFDEGHHLEEAFRSQLERSFSLAGLKRIAGRLYRTKGKKKKRNLGLIPIISDKISPGLVSDTTILISKLISAGESFFKKIFENIEFEEESVVIPMEELQYKVKNFSSIYPQIAYLTEILSKSAEKLIRISDQLKKVDELTSKEIKAKASRFLEYSSVLKDFFSGEDMNLLCVLEASKRKGENGIKFKIQPVDVSEELNQFYAGKKSVIITSATLSVNSDFSFFKDWAGLEQFDNTVEIVLPSPFDYEKQMEIFVPSDIPEVDKAGFSVEASEFAKEIIRISHGRTFLLFTSYSMLNSFYSKIFHELDNENFLLLKQGQFARKKLLEIFKKGEKAVLFGTDSFWEGVDVAGEKLSTVIITRLPFPVPTDPLYRARARLIRNRGGNEFKEYSIPIAALKLKQGAGRLIRTTKDKGVVIILDKRIITRSYGRFLTESLQSSNIISGKSKEILIKIREFLEEKNEAGHI